MPNDREHIPPSKERDDETIKLVRYLFEKMVAEEKTSREDSINYLPEYFIQWLGESVIVGQVNREEAISAAGVADIAWDFLMEIVHSPAGALQLAPVWPFVTLAYRGNPKYPIRRLHVLYIVTWEDGTIFPLSIQVPAELMAGGVVNDALAAAQCSQHFSTIQKTIINTGLDGIHDRFSDNYGGDYPYEVLMGALLKIIPQLDPSLHVALTKWMRLIQATVNPPIPPDVRARMEAKRQAAGGQQQPTIRPTGGFDGGLHP